MAKHSEFTFNVQFPSDNIVKIVRGKNMTAYRLLRLSFDEISVHVRVMLVSLDFIHIYFLEP